MKIYLITVCSRVDGGNETIETYPFKDENAARKKFSSLIEADMLMAIETGWKTEHGKDSYESFEDGYEMENHYIVILKEAELK